MLKKLFCVFLAALCLLTGCSQFRDTVCFNVPEVYADVDGAQMNDTMASREEFLKIYAISTKFLPKDGGNAHYYLVYQPLEGSGQADYSKREYGRLSWYDEAGTKSFHIYLNEEKYIYSSYSCGGENAVSSQIRGKEVMLFRIPDGTSQPCQATLKIDGYMATVLFYNYSDGEIVKLLRSFIKYN